MLAPWPKAETKTQILREPEWDEPEELGREIEADSVESLARGASRRGPARVSKSADALFSGGADSRAARIFPAYVQLPLFLVKYLRLPESLYGTIFTREHADDRGDRGAVEYGDGGMDAPARVDAGRVSLRAGIWVVCIRARSGNGAFASVVVWTFGEMILLPGSSAYAAEIAPPGRRGEYMGLYTMSFNIAFAVGPWVGANVLDRWGPRTLWGCGVCVRMRFGADDEPDSKQRSGELFGSRSWHPNLKQHKQDANAVPTEANLGRGTGLSSTRWCGKRRQAAALHIRRARISVR